MHSGAKIKRFRGTVANVIELWVYPIHRIVGKCILFELNGKMLQTLNEEQMCTDLEYSMDDFVLESF